jgi:hypothetical protein
MVYLKFILLSGPSVSEDMLKCNIISWDILKFELQGLAEAVLKQIVGLKYHTVNKINPLLANVGNMVSF